MPGAKVPDSGQHPARQKLGCCSAAAKFLALWMLSTVSNLGACCTSANLPALEDGSRDVGMRQHLFHLHNWLFRRGRLHQL